MVDFLRSPSARPGRGADARRCLALLLATCSLLLAIAPISAQGWEGGAAVAIRVTDEEGQAIVDAQIVARLSDADDLGPPPVATDAGGRALLSGLRDGEWFIEVSHPGYMLFAAYVNLRAGKKPVVGFSSQVNTATSWSPMTVKFQKASGDFRPAAPQRAEPTPPTVVRESTPPPAPPPVSVVRPELDPPPLVSPEAEATPPATPEPQLEEPDAEPESDPALAEQRVEVDERPTAAEVPGDDEGAATVPAEPAAAPALPSRPPSTVARPVQQEVAATPEPTAQPAATEPSAPPTGEGATIEVVPDAVEIPQSGEPLGEALPPTTAEPQPEPLARDEPAPATMAEERAAADPTPLPEPAASQSANAAAAEVEPAEAESIASETRTLRPVESEIAEPADPVATSLPAVVPGPATAPPATERSVPATPDVEPQAAAAPSSSARMPRFLRSAAAGTCSECQPGEWAVAAEQEADRAGDTPATSDCSDAYLATAREAAQRLADEPGTRLDGYVGPMLTAMFRLDDGAARDDIQEQLGSVTDPESNCQMAGIVLPSGTTFSGYVLEAWDTLGGRGCRAGMTCAVGQARWLDEPEVVVGVERSVVYSVFKNRSTRRPRRLRMTIYFTPDAEDWAPRTR